MASARWSIGSKGAVLVFGVLLLAMPLAAQARATAQQSMAQEARVTKDAARATALGKVPGGRVSTIELRRGAAGKLIYTAVIAVPGKPQKAEVVVDAMTGAVISTR